MKKKELKAKLVKTKKKLVKAKSELDKMKEAPKLKKLTTSQPASKPAGPAKTVKPTQAARSKPVVESTDPTSTRKSKIN
jgi:hypothetical protein